MIRILLVDDHQIIRDGIKLMLDLDATIECVGEAFNGKEAIKIYQDLHPDIVLLDINMPGMNGIECCKAIITADQEARIIALSMYSEISYIEQMMKNGASGYVLKNASQDELIKAIKDVMAGKKFYSDDIVHILIDDMKGIKKLGVDHDRPIAKVKRREQQILEMIVDEKTSLEIAAELFISPLTVETHRRHLLQKLEAKNTAGLVRNAIAYRLVDV